MLLRMLVGISGPLYTLDPGDEWHFNDDEAGRLIAAGFAEPVEPAKTEKPKGETDVVSRKGGNAAKRGAGKSAGSEAAGEGRVSHRR